MFQNGRRTFHRELVRVRELLTGGNVIGDREKQDAVFRELVRRRESVFRFSEIGTVLADDPGEKLKELFERHVNRQFAQNREYQETVMARRLTDVLKANDLMRHYRTNQRVGAEDFHVVMPIASTGRTDTGRVLRAIKPLDLNRDEPTKIYDHGDAWIKRVERLRQVNQVPDGLLFTIQAPQTDEKRIKACREIREELLRQDVRVVEYGDEVSVLAFARIDSN